MNEKGDPQAKSRSSSDENPVKFSRNKNHINTMTNTEDLTTVRAPSVNNRFEALIEKEDENNSLSLSKKEKRMNRQSQRRFGHTV